MQRDYGQIHNTILNVANDAEHSISVMPGLMKVVLEDGGWRKFKRPKDEREFTNETVVDWVLGPAYAGLGLPNWPTVYAILRCNAEYGELVEHMLIDAGAPSVAQSEIDVALAKARANPPPGQGIKPPDNIRTLSNTGGTSSEYLAARIQRDHPETFKALERGEFKSVRAAAKAAGIVRDLTPLENLERFWRKASADEQDAFFMMIVRSRTAENIRRVLDGFKE